MTGRKVLTIIVAAFFGVALLLIYNGFLNPVSTSGVGLPATVEQK